MRMGTHFFTHCIPNKECARCGWKEGPCDRHRIVPELGYVPDNCVSLCPNCHRLVTLKLISYP